MEFSTCVKRALLASICVVIFIGVFSTYYSSYLVPSLPKQRTLVYKHPNEGPKQDWNKTSWHPEVSKSCNDVRDHGTSRPWLKYILAGNYNCCVTEARGDTPRRQFDVNSKNPCWYEGEKIHCLPYFYLVGSAKCGTTDLANR